MTVVDDVKSRLDILEVVSQHVSMARSGRSYKANCPFHQEKTPSFFVFPDRQSWRCYGACATGGDVFSFVMKAENLDFGEALNNLAQQAGVALPNRERRAGQQAASNVNDAALVYFRELLDSAQAAPARAYLENRGLDRETIDKFELGFSPANGRSLKDHLVGKGFTLAQTVEAGVVRTGDTGWHGDLFRGRLMFPIRDGSGSLAGFGARALDDSQPKYLNSPRSPIFDKSRILYALYLAKEAARKGGLVIVEGYMDAISAHQHGFNNVVASMGTALTQEQVTQVKRLTKNVVMALDPDNAGQQATLRSLESSWKVFQAPVAGRSGETTLFQRQEMPELKIATLPPGEDPDQLIRRSTDEWTRLTESGTPLMDYLFDVLANQIDTGNAQGKTRLVELVFPLIAAVADPVQQDQYFQALADRLGVTQETLRASVGRPAAVRRTQSRSNRNVQATPSAFAKLDNDPVEDYCLGLLLRHADLAEAAEHLHPEYFRRHENREIFTQWRRTSPDDGVDVRMEALQDLMQGLTNEEIAGHLEAILGKQLPPLDLAKRRQAFSDTVSRLEERHLKDMKAEEGLKFSEDPPDLVDDSHQDVLDINQRIKENQSARYSPSVIR
ncbi:MAG: DNA primase [SAR202 cluster bacterium Io17-Chloro-G9]|nr:MAG: DNA primase [SAR202 cluster bacterium Io17-Chloro-G9]